MNIQKILLFIVCFFFYCNWNSAFAAINFTVTPLKYEIELEPWDSVTRSAQIRNNGTWSVTLTTAASDFQANWLDGTPSFVRKSELVNQDQQLSTWIDIDTASLTLAAWETKGFNFDITVPENATPGWHYGAVFFKNPASATSWGAEIWINVDYAVILIVNVAGEVVVDVEIDDVVINSWGWWGWGGSSNIGRDNCPFWDLTRSNFDGKCIDNFFEDDTDDNSDPIINDNSDENSENFQGNSDNILEWENTWEQNGIPQWENTWETNDNNNVDNTENTLESFEVTFQLPVNNNGNTHVKPAGKIKLIDEDGKEIQWIWKEVRKNDYGAVIWEEIVDYLPLNDEWGNVLPKTRRNFETTWQGFPYKTYDERGNQVIQYWKPGEYYTNKNMAENRYMMPWERVCEKRKTKTVQAYIEIAYENEDGESVQYNAADEFEIEYTEEYIGINPYVVIPLIILIMIWFFIWALIAFKKSPCVNKKCTEKLKRKEKICPECESPQDKKTLVKPVKKKIKKADSKKKTKKAAVKKAKK